MNSTRKQRSKGKRVALKDQLLLTTEELKNAVVAIEKESEDRKKGKRKRKRQASVSESETISESEQDANELNRSNNHIIEDCIVVA